MSYVPLNAKQCHENVKKCKFWVYLMNQPPQTIHVWTTCVLLSLLYMSIDPRVHGRGLGLRSKSRLPLKCAVYNVNVSSLSPYLKTIIGMCSFLHHRYPVGFVFIPLHHVLGTIYRGGAAGQNLRIIWEKHEQFSVSLQVLLHPQSIQKEFIRRP